jgi:hypothetical protein
MREWKLGDIIAERELTASVDGKTVPLHIKIGKPFASGEGEFRCPYQVVGLDDRIRAIAGIDSLQALYLTLQFIGSRLKHEQDELSLRWNEDNDLGLPALQMKE